jgi:hypothetical protein
MMPVWEILPRAWQVFLRISFRFLYSFGEGPSEYGPSLEYRGEVLLTGLGLAFPLELGHETVYKLPAYVWFVYYR